MLELSLRHVLTAYRHASKRIITGDFLYIEFSWCWTNYGSGRLRVCELSGRPGCSSRYIGNAPGKEAMAKFRWHSPWLHSCVPGDSPSPHGVLALLRSGKHAPWVIHFG